MANKFNIVITATDRASAVVRRFNTNINNLTRPIGRTFESFRRLGREIGQNKIVKGLSAIAKGATVAAKNIFSIGGAIAGVTLVTSAVAAIDWARNWAVAGVQLQNLSAITGQATARILTLRGAAKYLGLSADDLDGSLKNLGDTLEDATYGRNGQALALMNRLGISLKRTKDGAVDAAAALYDVSKALQGRNVNAQAVIARAFGVEALLPLLQKGPAGIAGLEAQARKAGAFMTPQQLAAANKAQGSFTNAGIAMDRFGNMLGEKITPIIDAFATSLNNWTRVVNGGPPKFSESPGASFLRGAATQAQRRWAQLKGAGASFFDMRPMGVRNNNPGNLEAVGDEKRFHRFAEFATPQEGISRLANQLLLYAGRGKNTIASILRTYAPPNTADANNLPAYISDVSRRTGLGANDKLNLRDPKVLGALTRGIIQHENGQQPYSDSLIDGAIKDRLAKSSGDTSKTHLVVTFKNAPKGTTAQAKTAAGAPVQTTLKVDYSMPDLAPP